MNTRILVFVALFSFSSVVATVKQDDKNHVKKNVIKDKSSLRMLYSSYIASLAVGGCIGATTGALIKYLERKGDIDAYPVSLLFYILSWMLESEIRNDVILGVQGDLDGYQIEYKKGLMFKSAWIASWLAYLNV
ncbi:MAG TPA: hypothetical protein VKR54_03880 [Candidatus Babeliales bacterium]|jgi:hypothetical protein|nr:hypothetical protein [Candidatus Babeliales bacterium]